MEKSPEYERIIAMLQRGQRPSENDWDWINRYLTLADKANGIATPVPFAPKKTAG